MIQCPPSTLISANIKFKFINFDRNENRKKEFHLLQCFRPSFLIQKKIFSHYNVTISNSKSVYYVLIDVVVQRLLITNSFNSLNFNSMNFSLVHVRADAKKTNNNKFIENNYISTDNRVYVR